MVVGSSIKNEEQVMLPSNRCGLKLDSNSYFWATIFLSMMFKQHQSNSAVADNLIQWCVVMVLAFYKTGDDNVVAVEVEGGIMMSEDIIK